MSDVDVVVIGSGGAGLTAAIVAHDLGADVVVIEKAAQIGGTYAYSTGLVWVPNNTHMREAGIDDSVEEAASHVRELSAGEHDEDVLLSFLEHAPKAVEYLEERAGVPFEMVDKYPDYYAERTGGKREGRYLSSPVLRTAEALDDDWRAKLVVSPQYAGLPASWREIQQWGGFGSIATWDWEVLEQRLGEDWRAFGCATIGFMLKAVVERGIPVVLETAAVGLERDSDGRVSGVRVEDADGERVIGARRGVLLATGGYDHNDELKRRWDPNPVAIGLGAPTVDGSGVTIALEHGAAFALLDGQTLVPTYHIPGEESATGLLYRLFVRESSFPGGLIVNRQGKRFADESFYRSVCRGMAEFDAISQDYMNHPAYFVFDEEWKMKYPLASVVPGYVPDWLARGETAAELAERLGIDPDGFAATVDAFNATAATGDDPEFGRGTTFYARNNGDPQVTPNPCVRPLSGTLYGLEIRLGTAGTSAGLVTGPNAEVLSVRGAPIDGLYAAGNVAANLVEGLWYNSGTGNARGITFGYLAARHMFADTVGAVEDAASQPARI
jgi:3-oxosteroid 1-dehydrogenase